jgi:predicted ferric reductase
MDKKSASADRGISGYALAILYVFALTAPLALALMQGPPRQGAWGEASSATGLSAGVALMLQFVTSGRFEQLSGRIGIDVTMAFHKWSARTLAVAVLMHPLLYIAPDFFADPVRGVSRILHMLTAPRYLTGVVSLMLIVIVVLLALLRDHVGAKYEAWRASHGALALLAAGLVVHHALQAGSYSRTPPMQALWPLLAIVALASALTVYGLRAWRMRRTPWQVAGTGKLADGLWELTLRRRSGERLDYRAGQFAWLAFGRWRFPLVDHPFSITSAPSASDDLSFIIKESGDFTNQIGAIPPGTPVGLDAPHGSFVLDETAETILLVAGGVGIAPILSLIRELSAREDRRPVRLVYAGARPDKMIAPQYLLTEAGRLNFRAIFLAEEADDAWPYMRGRVTSAIIENALRDLDPNRGKFSAMLCGPGAMMCLVCDLLRAAGIPLASIHYERFDYGDETRSAKDRLVLATFSSIGAIVVAAIALFAIR